MINQTAMTTPETPKTIDAGRRKELKKIALKKGGPNGADKQKQQDTIELRQMLNGASTADEAREIYEQLGKNLIPEEKFRELTKRFSPAEEVEKNTQKTAEEELAATLEEIAKTSSEETGTTETPAPEQSEEYSIEAYEEAPEDDATIALRTTLNEEISKLDQQLQDKDLEEFHEQIWRQIEILRKIESSHDPRFELAEALDKSELSYDSYSKIQEEAAKKLRGITDTQELTSGEKPQETATPVENGRWVQFIRDNMKRLEAERAAQRRQRKEADTEEDRLAAKARRKQKREKYLGEHPEEREYLEAKEFLEEETPEPTPEMQQISMELGKAEGIARQEWQRVIGYKTLEPATMNALKRLGGLLRKVEFLRHALKMATLQAQAEYERKKEYAKKLLAENVSSRPQAWKDKEGHYVSKDYLAWKAREQETGAILGEKLGKAIAYPVEEKAKEPKLIKKVVTAKAQAPQQPQPKEKSVNTLLKSLRTLMIRGEITPYAFTQTLERIRELKHQLIRGKITPQQFQQEIKNF